MATAITPIFNWQFRQLENDEFILNCNSNCFYSIKFNLDGLPFIEKIKNPPKQAVSYSIEGGEFFFISNIRRRISFFIDLTCFRQVIILLPYISNVDQLQSFFKTKNNFTSRHNFYLKLLEWINPKIFI